MKTDTSKSHRKAYYENFVLIMFQTAARSVTNLSVGCKASLRSAFHPLRISYITLTDKGLAIAREIYARHRFFAEHLVEIGIEPQTAESEACRIEHVISEETFQRLVEANRNAKEDTHHEN